MGFVSLSKTIRISKIFMLTKANLNRLFLNEDGNTYQLLRKRKRKKEHL